MERIRPNQELCDCIDRGMQAKMIQLQRHRPGKDGAFTKACSRPRYQAAFADQLVR